jgi:hypothetical protein
LNASSLSASSRHNQRCVIVRAALLTTTTLILLFVAYALVPVAFDTDLTTALRLAAGLILITAVIAWELRAVLSARYPWVRAVEAVVVAVALFTIVFALLYLGLAQAHAAYFTQPLDRVSAFYFTVTIVASVGFGDIAAHTDEARLVVTVQMVLDLTLIAVITRVFVWAARARVAHHHDGPSA